jgi:hypothetical protein
MSAAGFTVSRLDPNDGEWRKDGVNMVAIGQWTPIKRASMRHFNSLETSAEALPACAPDTRRRLLRTEPGMVRKIMRNKGSLKHVRITPASSACPEFLGSRCVGCLPPTRDCQDETCTAERWIDHTTSWSEQIQYIGGERRQRGIYSG